MHMEGKARLSLIRMHTTLIAYVTTLAQEYKIDDC